MKINAAASVSSAICAPTMATPKRPVLPRLAQAIVGAWRAWRAQVRLAREIRALEALSDTTLRDIGLAERVLHRPTSWLREYDRSRW